MTRTAFLSLIKSPINFLEIGWVSPSLAIGGLISKIWQASLIYSKPTPEVMIPISPSPKNTLLTPWQGFNPCSPLPTPFSRRSIFSFNRRWSSCKAGRKLQNCLGSFSKRPSAFASLISPSATVPIEWETLVVVRRKTGILNSSLISKASLVNSRHSWGLLGSSIGTLASRA